MAFGNMMNGMGGIGQQAADLRDSNTPQQLQQSYQKSAQEGKPDIATLLALNDVMKKVKEKEAEMRLAMQPKEPGTVLEQRAAELKNMAVGQNTTDVATNVGGGIAKKLRDEQNNMQRMAQGAQGAPQGPQMAPQGPPQGPPQGATQMAASGGIIMQGAPNLQRMAGGGIVGFAPGGEVKARTRAQLLEEVGVTEAEYARYTEEEKAELLKTINRNRMLAREVGTGISPNTTLAGLYDVASMPITAAGKAIGTVGKAVGLMDPQSRDPLQQYNPDGEQTWTPALDAINRQATRNQPITKQQLMGASTPPVGPFGGPEGDLTGINAMLGARARQQPPTNVRTPPIERPIAQEPGPARIAREEVPPVRPPSTVIGANTAGFSGQKAGLAATQAAYDKENRDRIAALPSPTDQRNDAANFSKRGGVQEQYAAMLAQRQALAEKQAAGRADNRFLRITAGMGSGPVLREYGASAVRDMDNTARLARNALTRQEEIQTGGIAADRGIAGKALDVQRTTTASNAQLDAEVTRAIQQSMTDQGRNLNADQQRALDAQKASMSSADKRALIESNKSIAQYNAKTREIIQNSVNDVTMASARLTAQANAAQNKNKAIADIVKKMADIQAKRPKQIADLAVANVVLTGDMDKKAKAAYLAERIKDLDTQMKLAIKPLEIVLAQLKSGVTPTGKSTNGKQ